MIRRLLAQSRIGTEGPAGQVIVIVALMLVVLVGIAGLAIDVSAAFATQRYERNVADAASLAGAQDLQVGDGRDVPDPPQYQQARARAIASLVQQLKPTSVPACATATTADIVNCVFPGTSYQVDVITDKAQPAPTCIQCEAERAVQVSVVRPSFGLALARVFGFTNWTVRATSVAGMVFPKSYGLITLRPPNPQKNGSDQNRKDINLAGTNTTVVIHGGDVGTNTDAFTNGSSTTALTLDEGFKIFHIDTISPDPWNNGIGIPPGGLIPNLITEPAGVTYPAEGSGTTYATQDAGLDPLCAGVPASLPFKPGDTYPGNINLKCYRPGEYYADFNVQTNTDAAYLESGVYIFHQRVNVGGYLFGGLISNQPGVSLVMRSDELLDSTNSKGVELNYGDSSCADISCRATAPAGLAGPGGIPLTIMVRTDDSCFAPGSSPRLPVLCTSGSPNNTGTSVVNLAGGGILRVAGMIWAPTDNVYIKSDNGIQVGTIGQIVAWTVTYDGGAGLTQETKIGEGPGVLRLDTGCAPRAKCDYP